MRTARRVQAIPFPSAVLLAVGVFSVLAPAQSGRAAYISEVFFDDRGTHGMPHAVELDRLDSLAADHAELLVIDAQPDNFGRVLRVVPVPTDRMLLLVSETDWPTQIWGSELTLDAAHPTLDELGVEPDFRFTFARSLMLYDRPTSFREDAAESIFSDAGQELLGEAELLDALTFVLPGGTADARAPEAVFEVDDGHAIVWPMDEADGSRRARRVSGEVDGTGVLAGTEPSLAVTPGRANPMWQPIPEPGTGVVLLAALVGAFAHRPHGRCSRRRLRL